MDATSAAHAIIFNYRISLPLSALILFATAASFANAQDETDPTAQQTVETSIEPTMPTPKLPYNMPPIGMVRKTAPQMIENAPTSNDGVALKAVAPTWVKGIGSAVPLPVAGSAMPVPGVNRLIRDAGGKPQTFQPPPPDVVSPGIAVVEDSSGNIVETNVPMPSAEVAVVEPDIEVLEPKKKRRLLSGLFKGKKAETEIIDENSTFISNLRANPGPGGPAAAVAQTADAPRASASESVEESAPAAARPVSKTEAKKNKFVLVEVDGGTQFFLTGEPLNGQSAILIPQGTVLQKMGINGAWTTVKSPNGTIGNIQSVALREASFAESMTFIKAGQ